MTDSQHDHDGRTLKDEIAIPNRNAIAIQSGLLPSDLFSSEVTPSSNKLRAFLDRQMADRLAGNDKPTPTRLDLLPQVARPMQAFLITEISRAGSKPSPTREPSIPTDRLVQATVIAKLALIYRDYPLAEVSVINAIIDMGRDQIMASWYPHLYQYVSSHLSPLFPTDWSTDRYNSQQLSQEARKELTTASPGSTDVIVLGSYKSVAACVAEILNIRGEALTDTWGTLDSSLRHDTALPFDLGTALTNIPDLIRARAYAPTIDSLREITRTLATTSQKVKLSLWEFDGSGKPENFSLPPQTQHSLTATETESLIREYIEFSASTPDGRVRYASVHIISNQGREWQLTLNQPDLVRASQLTGLLLRVGGNAELIAVNPKLIAEAGEKAGLAAKKLLQIRP